jgi:hypothetical protein
VSAWDTGKVRVRHSYAQEVMRGVHNTVWERLNKPTDYDDDNVGVRIINSMSVAVRKTESDPELKYIQ